MVFGENRDGIHVDLATSGLTPDDARITNITREEADRLIKDRADLVSFLCIVSRSLDNIDSSAWNYIWYGPREVDHIHEAAMEYYCQLGEKLPVLNYRTYEDKLLNPIDPTKLYIGLADVLYFHGTAKNCENLKDDSFEINWMLKKLLYEIHRVEPEIANDLITGYLERDK
jgi:hypothetical protein